MMSRQQRLIQLPLVGTLLFCLFVGVYLLAWKRFSKSGSADKVVKHSVKTSSDDVLKYWTADKMRNAKPVDMPTVNTLERRKQRPPQDSRPPQA